MAKKINFMGVEISTPEELAEEFKNHYNEAVDAILYSPKTIIKFVKKSNKKLGKEVAKMLDETEHSDNALAFFIYMILKEDVIYLRGRSYKLREFLLAYVAFKDKVDNEYVDFIYDKGLTRTFAQMDPSFYNDAYYLETNFDTELARNYLLCYFEKDIKQVFSGRLSAIAITGDECFKEASLLCNSEEFYLFIARKYGFTRACLLAGERNSLFDAIKLYTKEVDKNLLLRLVTDTFYWWLIDNYDKYEYDNVSKWLVEKIEDIKKEYEEQKKLLHNHKIDSIDFDLMADCSKNLYLLYLKFADYYKIDTIRPKNDVDKKKYSLDKNYCGTLICSSYMINHAVKLEKKTESEEISLSENPYDFTYEQMTSIINGYRKQLKYTGLMFVIILITLALGVCLSFGYALFTADFSKALIASQKIFENPIFISIFGISIIATAILSFIVYGRTLKSKQALKDYVKLNDIRYKEFVTSEDDEIYFRKRFYISKIKKDALTSSRVLSAFALGFLGAALGIVLMCLLSIVGYYNPSFIDNNKLFLENKLVLLYVLTGFGVGFLIGLIRKYKSIFTLVVVLLLIFAAVLGLVFVFK